MIINKELAYFLGIMCGDGYVSPNGIIEIKTDELKFLKNIYHNLVYGLFGLKPRIKTETKIMEGKKFEYYRSYFYSKKIVDMLNNFGIQSPKTFSVSIPEKIKNSKNEIKKSFLRGVFDTDGSIYTKKNKTIINYPTINLASRSGIFIKEISSSLLSLGLNAKQTSFIKRNKPMFFVRLYGFKELRKYIDKIGFSHPSKLQKANKTLKDGIIRMGQ